MGQYKQGKDTVRVIGSGILLVVVWIICYFVFQVRKKIGRTLSPKQLQDYVVGSVLIYGGVMKLSGLVYLTAQGLKCLGGGAETCTAITYPVVSISLMIITILFYRLAILPLSTTTTTGSQLGSLKRIKRKTKASMFGMMVVGFANTLLFSYMFEGEISYLMLGVAFVAIMALVFVIFVELFSLFRNQRIESGSREPSPSAPQISPSGDSQDKIMEKMSGTFV